MTAGGLLVPILDSVTIRETVAHAAERATGSPSDRPLHFVYPVSERLSVAPADEATALLERVEVWAAADLGEDADVSVRTAVVGRDQYLFNPSDYATVLARYAHEHDLGAVLLDPEINPSGMTPLLPPLERELERAGLTVDVAPVERATRRFPLARPTGALGTALVFGWALGFYLLLAGSFEAFELATGAMSAAVVAGLLGRVSVTGAGSPRRIPGRLARLALYAPYLAWEIAKANVGIAYVVLHPKLPIDPEVVEFDAAVWSELPATTLANSITLTPGTLTVDVTERHFTVHTLTTGARADLLNGGLERAVRFVFYGRSAARIPSPLERGAVAGDDEDVADRPEGATGEGPDRDETDDDGSGEGDR